MVTGFIKIPEFAERIKVSEDYARELARRSLKDKTLKLRVKKQGKEWIIEEKSINEYLGVELTEETYKKDLYIKELEGKLKACEIKLGAFETLVSSMQGLLS